MQSNSSSKLGGIDRGRVICYDHITFWVANAKQAASYYCVHLGFKPYAYKGLKSGSRDVVSHVLKQNDIIFEFQSPLKPDNSVMGSHLQRHGDGVKDIAFTVDNIDAVANRAECMGAVIITDIHTLIDAHNGSVRLATVQAFGDTTHTFVERSNYTGLYLPDYKEPDLKLTLLENLPEVNLKFIDHFAGVQELNSMQTVVEWYEKCLNFKKFLSIDEKQMNTISASLRSTSMNSADNKLNFNIIEPANEEHKIKSQSQEFLDFYGGPGIHHLAFSSDNIIEDLKAMKARGLEFAETPDEYYKQLRERLKSYNVQITENLDAIEELNILIDFDDEGYLMQIFTKPIQDRPTLNIEIIQRHNCNGYGVGNFIALFNSILAQQILRGSV